MLCTFAFQVKRLKFFKRDKITSGVMGTKNFDFLGKDFTF
jgi:hypothetical protein